jgi:hypothetical protein
MMSPSLKATEDGKRLFNVTRFRTGAVAILASCAALLTINAKATPLFWMVEGHCRGLAAPARPLNQSEKRCNARTMAYISNADSREIYVLELNEKDGSAKVIEKVAVAGAVMPMAISPDHKHLYASLRSEPYSVSNFAIDQTSGRLTPAQTVPLADNMGLSLP